MLLCFRHYCFCLVTKSCPTLCNPMNSSPPGRFLCPWDFPGETTGVGLPFPSSGDLPGPGIKPMSPALAGRFFTTEPPGKPIRDTKLYRGSKTHHHPSDLKIFFSLRLYSIPFGRWALLSEGPGYPSSGPWMPCQWGRALEGLSLHWQLNAVTQR